jgi:hypothetical protein
VEDVDGEEKLQEGLRGVQIESRESNTLEKEEGGVDNFEQHPVSEPFQQEDSG